MTDGASLVSSGPQRAEPFSVGLGKVLKPDTGRGPRRGHAEHFDARLQRDDSHKGEPVTAIEYETLQVEHVLPQTWHEHWPVEASDEGQKIVREQERSGHVHRIGNLTLVCRSLNPALSNAPWNEKRRELKNHSHLRLNARLCQETLWNEQAIQTRGEWLAEIVGRIWPEPNSDKWD